MREVADDHVLRISGDRRARTAWTPMILSCGPSPMSTRGCRSKSRERSHFWNDHSRSTPAMRRRSRAHHAAHCRDLPRRIPPRHGTGTASDASGEITRAARDQLSAGRDRDDGAVLRRLAGRRGRDSRRRAAIVHAIDADAQLSAFGLLLPSAVHALTQLTRARADADIVPLANRA
jgi:hypothetical protein